MSRSICAAITALATATAGWLTAPAAAVTFQQIVSREHPSFNVSAAGLSLGRDGLVYLNSGTYLLRLRPDGTGRADTNGMHYASAGIAANSQGLILQGQGHFAHTAAIFDAGFHRVAGFGDLNNDNFDAPQHVEAGRSGDFYACDARGSRIVRIDAAARVVAVYPVPADPANPRALVSDFRVAETAQLLAVTGSGQLIRLIGFDGTVRATLPIRGVFDMDDRGNTYVLPWRRGNVLAKFGPDGAKISTVKLDLGDRLPQRDEETFIAMRLTADGTILLKRNVPTELFERYDLKTGARSGIVPSDHQRVAVTLDSEVCIAGRPMPLKIEFEPGEHRDSPRWHVYTQPLGAPGWRELPLAGGRIVVPADYAGLYQLKVTPELEPWQRGAAAEYRVATVVEVRQPDSQGTASVMTPDNRIGYGRGEPVPITVLIRSGLSQCPRKVLVQLEQSTADWIPGPVLYQQQVTVNAAASAAGDSTNHAGRAEITLSDSLTRVLQPGHYRVAAVVPGLTCVTQPLVLGPGMGPRQFSRLLHGDMSLITPCQFSYLEAADRVAATLSQFSRLGVDFIVERLGTPLQRELFNAERFNTEAHTLAQRLAADPLAVAPEKARLATPLAATFGGYSAAGIRHMPILLYNDAGLPLGSGFDTRKPAEMLADLERVTKALQTFPALYGWDWACMWWHFGFGPTAEEKPAFDAALKKADETGDWDPAIEQVNARKLKLTNDAIALFNKKLHELDPQGKLKTAAAGPYRKVEAYPPVNFRDLDEIDLHYQCEQFASPYQPAHGTDFYKRPGKPCWGHPETYNDSGTGDQILPATLMMWMRGAAGVGLQSGLPPIFGGPVNDPRLANRGGRSVLRALNRLLGDYGNWSTTLTPRDPVAILASSRMFRADRWHGGTGLHFGRVLEAYMVCLANHTPASLVFTEDLRPETLRGYRAVLLVDQRYEPEPELAAAIETARAAGVPLFCDDTCRAKFTQGFLPLGIGCTHFDDGIGANHHDTAYQRMPQRIAEALPAVHEKLARVPPVAMIDNPEIYITQRVAGAGRFLFVVNNTNLPLDCGQMWRVSLFSGARLPVTASITLPAVPRGAAVYDLTAMCQVGTGNGGDLTVQADLRTLPLRLYAVLPAPIGQLGLRTAKSVGPGGTLAWDARVQDPQGRALDTNLPVHVRLLAAGGTVLAERFDAALGGSGLNGSFVVPINVPAGPLTLEAKELVTGREARVKVTVAPAAVAAPQFDNGTIGTATAAEPIQQWFGPHLRDVALSTDGSTALFGASNWDDNLYAVDLVQGKLAWQGRVGHWFAIAPQPMGEGFAMQGYDLNMAEGYHLYLTGRDGKPQRRFALYGLPQRLPHRFVPYLVRDRINNFATPAGGGWVAAAGDLGLAVWSPEGNLLWSQDWWKKPAGRHTTALAALGSDTLVVAEGLQVTAYDARSGKPRWKLTPAATGEMTRAIAAADGSTVALLASTQGGQIFIVRDGKLVRTFATPDAGDAALSSDGSQVAVVRQTQLNLYSVEEGFRWTFGGDSTLVGPRLSPDGKRLAIGSEMGTLYVFDTAGHLLLDRDLGAIATLAWLPDGDLLTGDWMGTICRLGRDYQPKWSLRVSPQIVDLGAQLTAREEVPTVRVGDWSNAEPATLPAGEDLSKTFTISLHTGLHGTELVHNQQLLHDGKTDPPAQPWLQWESIEGFAEMSPINWLQIDTGNRLLRLEGVTLDEDPAHPESWLRDVSFDRWDGPSGRWVTVLPLLSDAAVHSHRFPLPAEGTRFRIRLAWGCVGNVRLGEITLCGRDLGPSHPDVRAKRPVAVAFDENIDDISEQYQTGFCRGYQPKSGPDAYSGANYFVIEPWQGDAESIVWPYRQVTHWWFPIAEHPQPGEYRWVQFAAKPLSPATRRVTFRPDNPDVCTPAKFDHLKSGWQTYRVDLWMLWGKPKRPRVATRLLFGVEGGPAAFDQVLLGRSEADLDAVKPLPTSH